jgi:carboxylesterase
VSLDRAGLGAVDVNPFDLDAGGERGVLLVHGFTGTPYEVRPLGERLAARGITAVGPRLPGHCSTAEALNCTTWVDWVNTMEAELELLSRRCRRVAVVGLSLGGLIACMLARRAAPTQLAALCALATPLWLPAHVLAAVRLLSWVAPRIATFPKAGADIRDPVVKRGFPTMRVFPLLALRSLVELMPRVRAALPAIRVPTLVMHGRNDHVAPPACAAYLHRRVGASDKRLLTLPRSFHIITVDVERDLVAREVGDFIAQRM